MKDGIEGKYFVWKVPITILVDFFHGGGDEALNRPGEAEFIQNKGGQRSFFS